MSNRELARLQNENSYLKLLQRIERQKDLETSEKKRLKAENERLRRRLGMDQPNPNIIAIIGTRRT